MPYVSYEAIQHVAVSEKKQILGVWNQLDVAAISALDNMQEKAYGWIDCAKKMVSHTKTYGASTRQAVLAKGWIRLM